ncbi:hypothetical protein Ahy_A07g035256 [Arachis hypogaea]|uniref:Large ribosomal subunit protein uL15/eL18 domain-containing protein n=1 Tax=Arachis hypogaea TaxID=3818 RepID=A0A445CDL6_ARAHY|nr:hypothetical protein Ahy_A07g035256 [Arachis hypogaea]
MGDGKVNLLDDLFSSKPSDSKDWTMILISAFCLVLLSVKDGKFVEVYVVLQECLEMRKRYVFKEAVAPWDKEVISDPSTPKPNPQPFFYALEGKYDHYFEMQDGVIHLTPVLHLGAGACAGIIAMSATYLMDMVRGRITVQTEKSPYQYRGMFHALTTVLREEGPHALYKGSIVGLNFAVYESLKDWLVKSNPFCLVQDSKLSVTTRLACGAAPGTVLHTISHIVNMVSQPGKSEAVKHFGPGPGVPHSHTKPYVRSKGRKFERARRRKNNKGLSV